MGLVWNAFAIPGLVGTVAAWVLAATVYLTGPGRAANRRLGALLFLDGATFLGVGAMYVVDDPRQAYAFQAVNLSAAFALYYFYLRFLALLDTPLVAWLRRPWVLPAVGAVSLAVIVHRFLAPDLYVAAIVPAPYAPWEAVLGPARFVSVPAAGLLLLFALAATFDAHRRAPVGTLARKRAGAYALAFGVRDATTLALIPLFFLAAPVVSVGQRVILYVSSFAGLAFFVLLAYGILRTQLFDLDLRIKWTVRRGTVAAAFLAVFLVVTQVASEFLSDTYGVLLGGAAAGALLFALSPLQGFAARVADAAMPGVKEFSTMSSPERLALYREQARAAWADGALSPDERRLLDVARTRLGLSLEEATTAEREAMPA